MNAVPGQSLLQQHRVLQLLLAWLETFSVCAQTFSTFMCRTLSSNLDETPIILALFFAIYNASCLFQRGVLGLGSVSISNSFRDLEFRLGTVGLVRHRKCCIL